VQLTDKTSFWHSQNTTEIFEQRHIYRHCLPGENTYRRTQGIQNTSRKNISNTFRQFFRTGSIQPRMFPIRSCLKNSELGQRTEERQPSERRTPISNIRPVTFEMFWKSCLVKSNTALLSLGTCPAAPRVSRNPLRTHRPP
jgi:hypothetical protein